MANICQSLLLGLAVYGGTALAAGECAASPTTQTRTLSVPTSRPSDAAAVPADFVSFGFESAFLNDFANDFSENLVGSAAKRSGKPAVIRIGGTSGDKFLFDPNQSAIKVCVDGECPIGSNAQYILGPSYFDGFKSFPDARMTIQAPLGANVNTSLSLEYVRRAYQARGAEGVAAIALGNEPNFYDTAKKYADDAKALANNITKDLKLKDKRIFEGVDLAQRSNGWTVQDTFEAGLNSDKIINSVGEHYYQTTGKQGFDQLQATLMNHTAITSHLMKQLKSEKYLADKYPDVPFVLSEVGNSIGNHPLNYSSAFGATLWSVAFQLASMSRGVKRVSMTQRPVAKHALWVPNDSVSDRGMIGPSVRAPFSAQPFIADFVNGADGGGGSSVVEIPQDDPLTVAYAAFDSDGAAQRLALVNLRLWYGGCGGDRGSTRFDVKVDSGAGANKVTAGRLQAEAGVTAMGFDIGGPGENITYAGEQWTFKVDKGQGHVVGGAGKEDLEVKDGVVSVTVPDSEAVLVYLG